MASVNCFVCDKSMRQDHLLRHMAKHRNTLSTHMTEKARRFASQFKLPMMWEDGKYALCLICGGGKTKHSVDGSPSKFFKDHQWADDCIAKFATVRHLYGFDAPEESETSTSTSEEEETSPPPQPPTPPTLPTTNVVTMIQDAAPTEKKGVRLLTNWFAAQDLGDSPFDEIALYVIEEIDRLRDETDRSYAKIKELESKMKWT
jgi:hypothetical protein